MWQKLFINVKNKLAYRKISLKNFSGILNLVKQKHGTNLFLHIKDIWALYLPKYSMTDTHIFMLFGFKRCISKAL